MEHVACQSVGLSLEWDLAEIQGSERDSLELYSSMRLQHSEVKKCKEMQGNYVLLTYYQTLQTL